jgi:hypothetical protein
VTLLGAGLAAVVALAAARFVMGDGAGSEPSVETPSATASSTTTPAQADSGPTRADAATPAGAIDAGSEGDAADAGSSDASDAGADATSDAGADAATDDAGASADDADAPPNERDFPALVDELGDVPTLASEGYLIVRCPVRAEVFVNGVARGFTNSKVKSSCWTRNVRLRDPETQQWITEGQPVTITCMATTTVTIIP